MVSLYFYAHDSSTSSCILVPLHNGFRVVDVCRSAVVAGETAFIFANSFTLLVTGVGVIVVERDVISTSALGLVTGIIATHVDQGWGRGD